MESGDEHDNRQNLETSFCLIYRRVRTIPDLGIRHLVSNRGGCQNWTGGDCFSDLRCSG